MPRQLLCSRDSLCPIPAEKTMSDFPDLTLRPPFTSFTNRVLSLTIQNIALSVRFSNPRGVLLLAPGTLDGPVLLLDPRRLLRCTP